jgi:hypothetical protein
MQGYPGRELIERLENVNSGKVGEGYTIIERNDWRRDSGDPSNCPWFIIPPSHPRLINRSESYEGREEKKKKGGGGLQRITNHRKEVRALQLDAKAVHHQNHQQHHVENSPHQRRVLLRDLMFES